MNWARIETKSCWFACFRCEWIAWMSWSLAVLFDAQNAKAISHSTAFLLGCFAIMSRRGTKRMLWNIIYVPWASDSTRPDAMRLKRVRIAIVVFDVTFKYVSGLMNIKKNFLKSRKLLLTVSWMRPRLFSMKDSTSVRIVRLRTSSQRLRISLTSWGRFSSSFNTLRGRLREVDKYIGLLEVCCDWVFLEERGALVL